MRGGHACTRRAVAWMSERLSLWWYLLPFKTCTAHHRLLFFPPVTTRFNSTRLDTTLARSNGSLKVPTLLFYFLKAGQKIRTDRVQDGCASKGRAATASYYYVISSRRWLLVRGSLEGKAAAPYIRTAWRPARRASAVSVRTAWRPARRASAVSDV